MRYARLAGLPAWKVEIRPRTWERRASDAEQDQLATVTVLLALLTRPAMS